MQGISKLPTACLDEVCSTQSKASLLPSTMGLLGVMLGVLHSSEASLLDIDAGLSPSAAVNASGTRTGAADPSSPSSLSRPEILVVKNDHIMDFRLL